MQAVNSRAPAPSLRNVMSEAFPHRSNVWQAGVAVGSCLVPGGSGCLQVYCAHLRATGADLAPVNHTLGQPEEILYRSFYVETGTHRLSPASHEWIRDRDARDPAPVLKVLREQASRTGTAGRLDDQGVPERNLVTFSKLRRGEDQRNVHLDQIPLTVEGHDLSGFRTPHRRIELPGGHDVELLQHLSAKRPRSTLPEILKDALCDQVLVGIGAIVGVDEDVRVDERQTPIRHRS